MAWSRRSALSGLATLPLAACGPFQGNNHSPPDTPDSIAVRLPPIVRHEFGGDAQLYLVEDHGVPLVSLSVAIQAGFADDPPGHEGLARIVLALLARDDELLRSGYAELGTVAHTRLSRTSLGLRCTVHRDDALAALRLMIDDLRTIDRSPEGLERARTRALEQLAASRGSLHSVGGCALVHACMDVLPSSAALSSGSPRSLESLTPAALGRWIDHHVRPSRSSFAIAGAATLDEAIAWITEATSSWAVPARRDAGPPRGEPANLDPERHGLVLVPWAGADEAMLSFASPVGDYATADDLVLDYADGFVSGTVSDELRERQRATYSVDLSIWSTRAGEVRQNLIALAPGDVEQAITGVRERVAAWHDNPPGLRVAAHRALLSSRLGSYVAMMREYEDNESTLTQLLKMADVRLPVTAAHRRFEQLSSLDGDQVAKAILANFHADRMRWSVVADPQICEGVRVRFADLRPVTRTREQLVGSRT